MAVDARGSLRGIQGETGMLIYVSSDGVGVH